MLYLTGILMILFILPATFPSMSLSAERRDTRKAESSQKKEAVQVPAYPSMPSPGKKVPIGNDYYLVYGFDKKPKLGMIIMKIEVYTAAGKRDTSLEVLGDSGMPSMKGAHETGEQSFKISKKGDYLLPVNIVMPGDWEIRITVKKDGKVIFRGSHQFDV